LVIQDNVQPGVYVQESRKVEGAGGARGASNRDIKESASAKEHPSALTSIAKPGFIYANRKAIMKRR
jgi:hypothetical protein